MTMMRYGPPSVGQGMMQQGTDPTDPFYQPPPQAMAWGPGIADQGRNLDPMGNFQTMLSSGLGGGGGMAKVAGPGPMSIGGGGGGGGGGMGLDDMHPLEKAFLITSAISAAGDIGGSIYDRVRQRNKEREDKEFRDRAGKSLTAALARPART